MSDGLATALAGVVGETHVLSDPDMVAGYTVDWTRRWRGPAAVVVRPGSTAEVAAVVGVSRAHRVPIVPQGGNTGPVGGGVPGLAVGAADAPVVLSLTRLTGLDPVDDAAAQVTTSAGVTLARLQDAATSAGPRHGELSAVTARVPAASTRDRPVACAVKRALTPPAGGGGMPGPESGTEWPGLVIDRPGAECCHGQGRVSWVRLSGRRPRASVPRINARSPGRMRGQARVNATGGRR